jgi:hypothetical protein
VHPKGFFVEADVFYALFFQEAQVSEVFPTKAEAWKFAEKNGHVALVAAREEDPPRRILNLNYSIQKIAGDLGSAPTRPQKVQPSDLGSSKRYI